MAQCSQTAAEFIQSAFCPSVAVLCSDDAERICQKNNLSFVELMRPFCQLTTEGKLHCSASVEESPEATIELITSVGNERMNKCEELKLIYRMN